MRMKRMSCFGLQDRSQCFHRCLITAYCTVLRGTVHCALYWASLCYSKIAFFIAELENIRLTMRLGRIGNENLQLPNPP